MSTNSIRLAEIPIDGNGGLVWNRLHSEREDVCEALLKEHVAGSEAETLMQEMSKEDSIRAADWHRELLQARLRKIDDALDRLMSGSYGDCSKCGKWIEDTKLEFDPAIAFCISCWEREQRQNEQTSLSGVALETLAPFDTIWARTHNSDYRILLLDPKTGRALLEGGQFAEPVEGVVYGSTLGSSTFKVGWIGVGLRIEFWTNGTIVSTSAVQSVRVEHCTLSDPLACMSVVH
ncbi:MAG TPA: TraR/DksA C4-type zinc finger protein [Pyrinomonadaceae bacterium]|nr:TraR/DksA C4-type zinc finger protein [Pyrinomonadaceae bacterium]